MMAAGRDLSPVDGGDGLQPPIAGGQDQPARGFGTKLIDWLGKLHPPASHFPVALLVAAALAELLGIVTGRSLFEGAVRYCLWFGALGAVLTALLGWFMGGFQVADRSGLLTLHRWVGTAVAIGASLALVLGERSQRLPDKRGARLAFRIGLLIVALLVVSAGYLGGAMIYGLHHYQWW
jgi:uncharacterized membrane protein